MGRISKRIVDAARPGKKPAFVWDGRLAGFALLTLPSGAKSFVFQYRTAGRTRRATVGKVGAITPDQARTIAEGWSRMVKAGGDPLALKAATRTAPTVGTLCDRYIASATYAQKSETTQKIGIGQIERHLKPLLGKRQLAGLGQDDIRRAFAAIRDGQTAARIKTGPRGLARVTGGEGAARYACRLLRACFAWAVAEGLIDRNPATGVDFGRDGEREAALDAGDYKRLFATLARMETELRVRPAAADAIRIIAMTGARRGEISRLRWRYVDLKSGRIVLPPAGHKTGRKTGKPRLIHLPAAAQAIIAQQPEGGPDVFVFPSATGGPARLARPWTKIRDAAGLPENFGLHGLRHSVATALATAGAGAPQIMQTLGHRQLSTVAKYLHFADEARAVLAEKAAAPALAGLVAASGKPKAPVVSLPRKGRR